MTSLFPGFGTVLNVLTVLIGAGLGMLVGHRLREHTRSVVTDCLGLVTLLVAGLSAVAVTDPALRDAVGAGFPVLIVLGSLLIGSITGSALRIEDRLEGLAGRIQAWVARRGGPARVARTPPRGNGSSKGGSRHPCCSASARSPSSARSTTASAAASTSWR